MRILRIPNSEIKDPKPPPGLASSKENYEFQLAPVHPAIILYSRVAHSSLSRCRWFASGGKDYPIR